MQKIPLALARPGFVLAKPVLRDNGMVLVAQGTELSEALLDRLGGMGVESLTVDGEPVDMEGAGGIGWIERAQRLDHTLPQAQGRSLDGRGQGGHGPLLPGQNRGPGLGPGRGPGRPRHRPGAGRAVSADLRGERKGHILAVKDLPTLPKVLDKVSRLVEDPDSSTDQIARVVSMDQVLAAKVLKMVNSPIYGFPGRIGSINHALVLLGYNVIKGIIISTSVFDIMHQAMAGLWEHSLGAALACRAVAETAGFKDPGEYSVPGLLHDLGKVVCAVQLPRVRQEIEAAVAGRDCTYLEAERDVLGFGHDTINAWLADHWRLPLTIKEGMSRHHRPLSAEHHPHFAATVHVADFMVRLFEYGSGGDDNVPVLDEQALGLLKLELKDLEAVADRLADEFLDVADISFV